MAGEGGLIKYQNIEILKLENETDSIAQGFTNASIANLGSGDATITMNDVVWTVPAGTIYNLPETRDARGWMGIEIAAETTIVECTYYK